MKSHNLIFGSLCGVLWLWSLVTKQEVVISILIGILTIFLFFFDDLLYKPIELIGWNLKEVKQEAMQSK